MTKTAIAAIFSGVIILLGTGLVGTVNSVVYSTYEPPKVVGCGSRYDIVVDDDTSRKSTIYNVYQVSGSGKVYRETDIPAAVIFDSVRNKYPDTNQLDWLALTVTLYCEARGESWYGIAAVADTIRNRVKSGMFPDTYYAVVTQDAQFSCISSRYDLASNAIISNDKDEQLFRKLLNLARRTINGELKGMTNNALFYHTTTISPYWAKHYHRLGVVGDHIFYTATEL